MTLAGLKSRCAWWLVCLLPQWLASKWLWSRVPMPASWAPYVFGRSIGREGRPVTGDAP